MRHYNIMLLASAAGLLLGSCLNSQNETETTTNETIVKVIPKSELKLTGSWTSDDNPFYPELEFKGKSTVIIKTFLGSFVSGYERDEEFIRVQTDKSDLLFEIISNDTIVGSGFADGTWIRKQ